MPWRVSSTCVTHFSPSFGVWQAKGGEVITDIDNMFEIESNSDLTRVFGVL